MNRSNHAPTATTIIVALVLIIAGLLGTFGSILSDQLGILAFVAATVLLLVGMMARRI